VIALSDTQLTTVMRAATLLPVGKRDVRVAAMLKLRRRFGDTDVADAVQLASSGLIHQPAA
jgi:hypothetical protein